MFNEQLLSKTTVAAILGVHPNSLTRLVQQGRFPKPIKMGTAMQARARWRSSDVEAWLTSRAA